VADKEQNKTPSKKNGMTYLITGGCGFVGSNIAAELIERGDRLVIFDDMSRIGAAENLKWLQSFGQFEFVKGDVSKNAEVAQVIEITTPDVIFHLAGQVAMTTSMKDPRHDFVTNVLGSFNVLESVRLFCPGATIIYSSSNKVYGELSGIELCEEALRYSAVNYLTGIDESVPLDFQTPYGCSKGAADQYMLDYARAFNLNTVVFRHSTVFGGRQFATFDQGWVGWFCRQALEAQRDASREPFTISGTGKQVRDLLFVDDCVACYFAAVDRIKTVRGHAFNIGGGMANSSSLLELFQVLEGELGIRLRYTQRPWRHGDQKFFVADNTKAERMLGWKPRTARDDGIVKAIAWARQTM
jgi:CDP-paratose 2-epimerase